MRTIATGIILAMLLTSMLTLAFNVKLAETEPLLAASQEPPSTDWSQTFGGTLYDYAYSVIQTSDGGYVIAGLTDSYGAGNSDLWLVKTNSAGVKEWSRTHGGTGYDGAKALIQTSDGGYAIAGYTSSFGSGYQFYLVKTNSSGHKQWEKSYGGTSSDQAFSIVLTGDGGYALAGYTTSYGAGSYDIWLVKTDSAGVKQWSQTYGKAGYDGAKALIQTSDGGYAIAGYTNSYGAGSWDIWLVKTGPAGTEQWNKTYGGPNYEDAWSVIQTADSGYALAGCSSSFGAGNQDSWLVKTDSFGVMQWSQPYGGTGFDYACSVVRVAGGYAIGGYTDSYGAGNSDFWLIQTDFSGVTQWDQTYGGTGYEYAYSMIQTRDGGYALAGSTDSYGAGDYDFWLVKICGPPVYIPSKIKVMKSDGQVQEMVLEEYLRGVVCTEMSPSYIKSKFGLNDEQALEALKAQAIVSRTWAAARVLGIIPNPHRNTGAHVCTTQHCQAWSNNYQSLSDQAVQDTRNLVLTFKNKVIQAYFFAHCDGKTRTTLTAYSKPWKKDLLYCRSVECVCGETTMLGHGVGMCQWGISEMAKLGSTYADILDHYFSGVEVRLASALDKFNVAKLECPGELRVYDSENRVTGLVQGVIREEISNSSYDEANRAVIIVAPNSSYRYEVEGIEEGIYDLAVNSVTEQETAAFACSDIPIWTGATNQYTIDWAALSQGGEGVTIEVDNDGNGSPEYTFSSDSELNRTEYVNATTKHDIGIVEIFPKKSIIGQGYNLPINTTIVNYGAYTEISDVTVYLNTTLLASQTVTLANASHMTISFIWNTTDWLRGNYTLAASVAPVPGESFIFDNALTDDQIVMTIPGDVNGDHQVDAADLIDFNEVYGSTFESPTWNANCDISGDNKTDVLDLFIHGKNYGRTFP